MVPRDPGQTRAQRMIRAVRRGDNPQQRSTESTVIGAGKRVQGMNMVETEWV
jgi:hypothetical protein